MKKRVGISFAVAATLAATLAGCGGSSSSSTSTAAAAAPDSFVGIFRGTTGDARTFFSVVLTNGTFYDFYSGVPTSTTTNPVGGVVIGTGAGSNGSFSTSSAYDYQAATSGLSTGVSSTTLSATYSTYASMNGTFTHNSGGAATTFASTYDSSLTNASPSLTNIAGIYSGTVGTTAGGTETLSFIILPSGAVTGQSASGCFFTGTTTTHSTNNAYDITVTFASNTCTYNGMSMTGMGIYDSTAATFYGATVKTDKTAGIIFVVKKTSTT